MAEDSEKTLSEKSESKEFLEDRGTQLGAEGNPPQTESGLRSSRETSFSRRALVRAGWAVPVIMAVTPPRAYAQASPAPGHGDSVGVHADTFSHADLFHGDLAGHFDFALHFDEGLAHGDSPPHMDT